MLYKLLYPLRDIWFGFNVLKYITFRSAIAAVTAFFISLFIGRYVIDRLANLQIWQNVRTSSCPGLIPLHQQKQHIPSMGGLIILFAIIVPTLLWADLKNSYILIALTATVWFGLLGFLDDYLKLVKKKSSGLAVTTKLIGQIILGLLIGLYVFYHPDISTKLDIPFCKNCLIDLGIFYILFAIVVIVGSSNAVNLTDGLDGLAIGCVVIAALTYAGYSYVTGHAVISNYLQIPFIPKAGELTVFCSCIIGAGLGFLWFNSYPATIFMGDTGSLALGGAIGIVAIFIKKELLLLIVGGIFVAEALSVILQVTSFKLRGKRMFLVAPLHHHLQLKGWDEPKITVRLWLIAIILALLSLATLKLR
ncbi:MAG: phospho-N-acetylmuramoyl-pentapeptide-transferase [Candidatus Omnitrophica bacterium]|nr:phospho-N-acetylmuramoyl-pentapeptide-transferase [Candidatus Omnitrophota bacterium]